MGLWQSDVMLAAAAGSHSIDDRCDTVAHLGLRINQPVGGSVFRGSPGDEHVEVEFSDQCKAIEVRTSESVVKDDGFPFAVLDPDEVASEQESAAAVVPEVAGGARGVTRRRDHLQVVVDHLPSVEHTRHREGMGHLCAVAFVDVHGDVEIGRAIHGLVAVVDQEPAGSAEVTDRIRGSGHTRRVVDDQVAFGAFEDERPEQNILLVRQARCWSGEQAVDRDLQRARIRVGHDSLRSFWGCQPTRPSAAAETNFK